MSGQDQYWYEQVDSGPRLGRLARIARTAHMLVHGCLALQPGEQVVIVTDDEVSPLLYETIAAAVYTAGGVPVVAKSLPPRLPHEEPPDAIAAAMYAADVIVGCTSRSITHAPARERATGNGRTRFLGIPQPTEDLFCNGAATADFDAVRRVSRALAASANQCSTIHLTSPAGTDVSFSVGGRQFIAYYGSCRRPGNVNIFPGGEVNTLPHEDSVEGEIVFDSSIMEIGLLAQPVRLRVERGTIVDIAGGVEARRLSDLLARANDDAVYHIGEFAMGTNPNARTIGSGFEDKEVAGTVHMAVGSGLDVPGKYSPRYPSAIHLDGVMLEPTVVGDDGRVLVDAGRIAVEVRAE